jgi:hypothetical protein
VTGYTHIGISRNITGTCTVHILSPVRQEIVNSTAVQNATAALPANQTPENTMPGNSSANATQAGASATPGPEPSTLGAGVYALLAILLVAVAGFAAYALAFRKK